MSLKGAMDPIWCIDGISVWKYGIFTWIKQIIVKVINNFEINFFICDNLHALYIFILSQLGCILQGTELSINFLTILSLDWKAIIY